MIFKVYTFSNSNRGKIIANNVSFDCVIGKNGKIKAEDKREGDGKSPIGTWPVRYLYWRDDRVKKPKSILESIAIEPDFGWCDGVEDENYNKFVKHPYKASAEKMWREDELYDICVVLGHNDAPVVKGMGSAIFWHCAKPNYEPTEGCVALKIDDLRVLLEMLDENSQIQIMEEDIEA